MSNKEYLKKAIVSGNTGWITKYKNILLIQDNNGNSVAHWLAFDSNETGWVTDDIEILLLQNDKRSCVLDFLISYHPTWTTTNKKILELETSYNGNVKERLLDKGRYIE